MAPKIGNPYIELEKNPAAQTNPLAPTDLAQLQTSLSNQIGKNGIALPEEFFADGIEPGFFGALDRSSQKTNDFLNSLFGLPPIGTSEGYMDGHRIFGIDKDGAVRDSLRKGAYAGDCRNYLDSHFDEFQRVVALHETAHYVDHQLGLSKGINARIEKDAAKLDPGLTERSRGTSPLEYNLSERVADAASVIYAMSNYGDSPLYQKIMDWRDGNRERTHYASSTTEAAIDAFRANPRKGMDIVAATRMAADAVESNAGLVIQEQHELQKIPSANQEPHLLPSSADSGLRGQIINRSEVGRDALCERPLRRTPQTVPAPR